MSNRKRTVETVAPSGIYKLDCYGPDGRLKWSEYVDNLVTDLGKNNYLKAVLKGDDTIQASSWFVGLIADTTANITLSSTDIMTAHGGWSESTHYSEGTRQTWSSGAVGSTATGTVSNSSAVASFSINAGTTIGGAFLCSTNIKGGTGGLLHSESKFSQTRNPSSGDTIEVTIIQKAT